MTHIKEQMQILKSINENDFIYLDPKEVNQKLYDYYNDLFNKSK